MKVDMSYDGQILTWQGWGKFKATSGLPHLQKPELQCITDAAIPEGLYKVFLADRGTARDIAPGRCQLQPAWGMQTVPRGLAAGECEKYWAGWGWHRARMEPFDAATKLKCFPVRGGFFLHDSTKGYSHGCIEVEGRLFSMLENYRRSSKKNTMTIKVAYVKGRPTNGGTKK
jgi:hypothetical protein